MVKTKTNQTTFSFKLQTTGCRNIKLLQEMELSAQVWKSVAACAHEEDEMKQTKTT